MLQKRGILILAAVIASLFIVLPIATAKIVIINDFRDMYNFGETVTVDGYILADETADGTVALELQCPGYSKVNSVHLAINKRHMVRFSQLGIGDFVLPDAEGSCDIEATFDEDSVNSDSFTLLNDLLGAFEIVGDGEYQLGEVLLLEGIVFKLDGSDIESGNAKIFLEKKGEYPIQFGDATVTSGVLEFSKTLSNLDYGDYSVDVKVSDGLNSQYFDDVADFTVKTRFDVTVSTNKYTYDPGEEVVVKGEIDGLVDSDDVDVVITFDALLYNTKPTGDSFEYRFYVPSSLKAGSYELEVKVSDSHGNEGGDEFDLTVEQVPAKIINKIDRSSYNPGETLTLEVQLLDQSSTTMSDTVRVKITDPVGAELYNGDVNTRQDIELTFGQYARDGTYTIVSTYSAENLDDTDRVTVNKVSGINTDVDGRTIYVKNSGNIDYDDRVDVVLVSEKDGKQIYYVLAKDVSLDPGEETTFDLSYDVPEGLYNVIIDDSGVVSTLTDAELADYIAAKQAEAETTDGVYSGVDVDDDQREFGTKLNQGFGSVTGASTISTYDRKFTPWFLLLMVVLFGGLLGLYAYQRREVIKRRYKDYKETRKRKKRQEESPIADISHAGDISPGDVSKADVDKLLARVHDKPEHGHKKMNIGTDENRRIASIKVKHVKPGTTTLVPHVDTVPKHLADEKKHGHSVGHGPHDAEHGKKHATVHFDKEYGHDKGHGHGHQKEHGHKVHARRHTGNAARNRFSTWNPPAHSMDNFKAKNPVKMKEKKEKTHYQEIDEDFLRDEKFE